MRIKDVDPIRAEVLADLENGKFYTYTMTDLTKEEHVPVLAAAVGFVTVELKRADAEWKAWQAEQFIKLRQPRPSVDGKAPKRTSEKEVEAAIKTSDAFLKMRAHVGRATGAANMLEVVAALVTSGKFQRADSPHSSASGRS